MTDTATKTDEHTGTKNAKGFSLKSAFSLAAKIGTAAIATSIMGPFGAVASSTLWTVGEFCNDYRKSASPSLISYWKDHKKSFFKKIGINALFSAVGFGIGDYLSDSASLSDELFPGETDLDTPTINSVTDEILDPKTIAGDPSATTIDPVLSNAERKSKIFEAMADWKPKDDYSAYISDVTRLPTSNDVLADILSQMDDSTIINSNTVEPIITNDNTVEAGITNGDIDVQPTDINIPVDPYQRLDVLAQNPDLSSQAQSMIDAASQGQNWAIRDIGLGLINGQYGFDNLGTLTSHVNAESWGAESWGAELLKDAAATGDIKAQIDLSYFEYHGTVDGIAQNRDHALGTINTLDKSWAGGEHLLKSYTPPAQVANDHASTITGDESTTTITPLDRAKEIYAQTLPAGESIQDYNVTMTADGYQFNKIHTINDAQRQALSDAGMNPDDLSYTPTLDGQGYYADKMPSAAL